MKLKNYGRNQKKRKEYIQQGWPLLKKLLQTNNPMDVPNCALHSERLASPAGKAARLFRSE